MMNQVNQVNIVEENTDTAVNSFNTSSAPSLVQSQSYVGEENESIPLTLLGTFLLIGLIYFSFVKRTNKS